MHVKKSKCWLVSSMTAVILLPLPRVQQQETGTSNATSGRITEVYNVGFEKRPGEGRAMVVALRPISAGEAGYKWIPKKRWHPDLEPCFHMF